jgi:hypothetical protein
MYSWKVTAQESQLRTQGQLSYSALRALGLLAVLPLG